MLFSVIVPVYGCREALCELYRRLTSSILSITDDYEIILVNDCCPQNSWELIEDICSKDHHVIGLNLSRNFGQMKAILAGLDYSKGDFVVVMDCDLQDRPEEIQNLYSEIIKGYDIVFARRKKRQDGILKKLLSGAFYKVYKYATDGNYDGAVCNFSIVRRNVVENYCKMREYHRGYVMYMKWLGYKQSIVDVAHDERYEGKSSYNLKKRFDLAVDLLTSQSDKILRLFLMGGFIISFVSFFSIIFLLLRKLLSDVPIGWTSLIATMMFIGGVIIMVIGVVGMYVGNIFMQTKNRPLYIVREKINR
ncbi:dolichol-phosphate mannosyltransferase [Succinivibrio dextrinosolvens DSM 3072]|uniref:Dolichol-phosphate mannosyltransferase n=1 Tax=Succinivibrio dextrinosolvens DSM 3072 TaxID=1123324 RepID=A0A1T4VBQ5_9GAMM|nr:glycosyltransferase family 2 protein [Succinivibrio dextrinosolvens]SKA62375.1 dolichol-phosphate mannosyltransferase [Succinivibrio dextrinosolvens DSM 3072]